MLVPLKIVAAIGTAFQPADDNRALGQVDIIPAQVAGFGDPQAVPVDQEEEMAWSGIKDQRQLADDAVRFLEANYNDNLSNCSKPDSRSQRLRTAPTLLSPGN